MFLKLVTSVLFILVMNSMYSQGEFIVEYDLENNSFNKIGSKIDDVTFIIPGFNTFDENSSIFYFLSSSEQKAIYGINTETGEIQDFLLSENLWAIEFSNSLNKLFAIETDQNSDTKQLVSIDFISNQIIEIGSPINSSSMFQGFDSFNDKDLLYTFTAPPNTLYSISAVSGEIIYNPSINLAPGQAIQHYDYNPTTGKLYTLASENQGNSVFLATINIETGDISKIGESITDLGIGGSSTINSEDDLYLYLHLKEGKNIISTISLETGENVSNTEFIVDDEDNLIDIEYNNNSQKIFSKHWDATTTSTLNEMSPSPKFFPNPATNSISFKHLPLESALFFDVYNSDGKQVLSNVQILDQKVSLSNLHNGIYFANIYTNDKLISICKFIIQK